MVTTDRAERVRLGAARPDPDKGDVLTKISLFGSRGSATLPNHLVTIDVARARGGRRHGEWLGRSLDAVRKAEGVAGRVHRARLPGRVGPEGISMHGHRLRRAFSRRAARVGRLRRADLHAVPPRPRSAITTRTSASSAWSSWSAEEEAEELRETGRASTRRRASTPPGGIIIADTKFEFGRTTGVTLIDEVLTPDSSRFWPADEYAPGRAQPSFDKQFVRDWLEATGGTNAARTGACPPRSIG